MSQEAAVAKKEAAPKATAPPVAIFKGRKAAAAKPDDSDDEESKKKGDKGKKSDRADGGPLILGKAAIDLSGYVTMRQFEEYKMKIMKELEEL